MGERNEGCTNVLTYRAHVPTPNELASILQHCATLPVVEWLYGEGLSRTGNKCTSLVDAGMGSNPIRSNFYALSIKDRC